MLGDYRSAKRIQDTSTLPNQALIPLFSAHRRATFRQIRKTENLACLFFFSISLSLLQSFFVRKKDENEAATEVIFRVVHLFAKRGKSFTDRAD